MDPLQLGNAGTPEERRTGLGGSEAAAVIGLSPWMTPLDLWEQKTGRAPPVEQTEPMLWGHLLENVIRQEYGRRTGLIAQPVQDMVRHQTYPWMFAHIDGRIDTRRILEVKTTRTAQGWGDEGTDEIPPMYLVQVHHYLAVTAAELCDIAVLIGGQDFRVYQVARDRDIEGALIEQEADFWRLVTSDTPPTPMTVADAVKLWGRFGAVDSVTAGEAEIDAVRVLRDLHLQRAELDQVEERARLVVMSALGDRNCNLVHPSGELLATWKLDNGRKAYSVAAKEPSRRLLVKYRDEAA